MKLSVTSIFVIAILIVGLVVFISGATGSAIFKKTTTASKYSTTSQNLYLKPTTPPATPAKWCKDTDANAKFPGGKNIYLMGTCTSSAGYGSDECVEVPGGEPFLNEWYCDSQTMTCKDMDKECGPDAICIDGTCCPNGPNGEICTCADVCVSGSRSCINGGYFGVCGNHDDDPCLEWPSVYTPCAKGEMCVDGNCVPCVDTDGGKNYAVQGTVAVFTDSCYSQGLWEWYCDLNTAPAPSEEQVQCRCVNGACV